MDWMVEPLLPPSKFSSPRPRDWSFPTTRVPAVRSTAPLNVFDAMSTKVPLPALVIPPMPLTGPPTVSVLALTTTILVIGLKTAPVPRFRLLADPA